MTNNLRKDNREKNLDRTSTKDKIYQWKTSMDFDRQEANRTVIKNRVNNNKKEG